MTVLRTVARRMLGLITATTLALAALLTFLRTIAPTGSWAVQLVAFSPLVIPLALLGLAAALALVAVTRGGARRVALACAILAGLLGSLGLVRVAPWFIGDRTTPSAGPALTVAVQNLEYGDPLELADLVLRTGADVLVVSDAGADTIQPLRSSALTQELRYAIGLRPWGPEGSVIFSRYPMTEVARISDGADSRAVVVHTPQFGDVDLLALHPTPPYQPGGWSADYERITAFVTDAYGRPDRTAGRPAVIAGDLNATLDHAPMRRLSALGFTDGVVQVRSGFRPTWPAPGSVRRLGVAVPPLVQIDHVMTSRALMVTDLVTFRNPGSDHLGLLARIERAAS